jgi:hypothetical protein
MTTGTTTLPLSLFWTLEAGFALTLALLLWVAQALRRWPGGPLWTRQDDGGGTLRGLLHGLLLLAISTVIALALLVVGCQLGTFTTRSFDASTLFNLALLGLVLAGALHLGVAGLWPRQPPTPTVRPPTPPLTQQSRREARRWKH